MILEQEIARYGQLGADAQRYKGKWVLISGDTVAGFFESFASAAIEATRKYGRGPYLIREVGVEDVVLPASVVYSLPKHGA